MFFNARIIPNIPATGTFRSIFAAATTKNSFKFILRDFFCSLVLSQIETRIQFEIGFFVYYHVFCGWRQWQSLTISFGLMDAPDVVSGGKGQVVLRLFSVLENGQNQIIKIYSVTDVLNRNGNLGSDQFLDNNLSYFIQACTVHTALSESMADC
jgi:hypothetical protein